MSSLAASPETITRGGACPEGSRPVKYVDIMDTTLRDGEQTSGVSISPTEKLLIAQRLLEVVGVDRIEVASCRVSDGEQKALRNIMDWAAKRDFVDRVEVLSFVDFDKSVEWMYEAGCRRVNLLTKGSRKHCEQQLRKTPQAHLDDIRRTVDYAVKRGVTVCIYLEDGSNGMLHSPDYVYFMMDAYADMPFERILFPDTLGILNPWQVETIFKDLIGRYGSRKKIEFHGHDDYGLAVANALTAVTHGASGIHCTVNGLGERAGNTPLEEFVAALHDHTDFRTRAKEEELVETSRMVEVFSGKRVPNNKPIVGANVFTQTAGIHADGDKKGDLYASELTPHRFGRDRLYALGKLAGRASLDMNLEKLGITLTPEQHAAVLQRIVQLGDAKQSVTVDDLPFLISDVLEQPDLRAFEVKNCLIVSSKGVKPIANVVVRLRENTYEAQAAGNGGYDAFMNALRSMKLDLPAELPGLVDYEVHIPPGGKSDALVETKITWANGIQTRGVNTDQVMAAVEATERVINMIVMRGGAIPPLRKPDTVTYPGKT